MNDDTQNVDIETAEAEENGATEARVGHDVTFSRVWLVPIVALVIGLWMTWSYYAGQGSIVEITFHSAEGIQAGTTKVRTKNVEIGEVLDLKLSEDAEQVMLSVRIYKNAEHLLREDSRFWVVRPRIGVGGISGLNTLLSGAYIELSPGSSEELADNFVGLERPPVTPLGTPGLHVTLDSAGGQALRAGDPVVFQGIEVGRIENTFFDNQKRRSFYNAFIVAPYDELVTENTRFWFNSGLSAELSADGVRIDIGSLETVLGGGVAFDVPDGLPLGERIVERGFFTIYPNENASREVQYENALSYIVLFDDSIRGLRPGAPVEYRGVKVGEVVRTDIDYVEIENLLDPRAKIPVMIDLIPARLGFEDDFLVLDDVEASIDELIERGLTAELSLGSLLTGQKYIELHYHGDGFSDVQSFDGFTVIPSIDGHFDQLLANASNVMQTVQELPLDDVVASATTALNELSATLTELRKSATQLDAILADPASHEVMGSLNATLLGFQQLATDFSEGSATNRDLQQSLQSLARTLNELEPVLRNVRRKPNSLVFGASEQPDPEPKGERK
ncbi:MAG: intermembrane transport protein PqiB [Woeseiaceae bacterium]|nr:intermembrane transport protein PqiB [Woeseiaceae bacterium]